MFEGPETGSLSLPVGLSQIHAQSEQWNVVAVVQGTPRSQGQLRHHTKSSSSAALKHGVMRMRIRTNEGTMMRYLLTVLLVLATTSHGRATTIEWYRTAQGTSDRITSQANLSFGADFASDATITVNRSVSL